MMKKNKPAGKKGVKSLEKVLEHRANHINQARIRKEERQKNEECKERLDTLSRKLLEEDSRKKKMFEMIEKKAGKEKFISAFSYIIYSAFDRRDKIPAGYRAHLFNEDRRYIDFFKQYIYPYSIPCPIILASIKDVTGKENNKEAILNEGIIVLSKKWIKDIVSGSSFYKANKAYFTKNEAHYFLSTNIPYESPKTVYELFYMAKCKARNININKARIISKLFVEKFKGYFNHEIVMGFLNLLAREKEYPIDTAGLGDICDFVKSKIHDYNYNKIMVRSDVVAFSFSGRTMTSVIALANEWHANVQREQEALNALARAGQDQNSANQGKDILRWKGINVYKSSIENKNCTWTVTQLLTLQDLINEGRKMKNCVASYANYCVSGEGTIFNVTCKNPIVNTIESKATLQVSRDRLLLQAREKCNRRLSSETMKVIRKWAQANRIKIDERILL